MDFREFFAIVERDLDILNPTSHEKLMLLADYCGVQDGSRILDIGSGKGYMLRAWSKRWEIEAVGLEINPHFISDARRRSESENVSQGLTFLEGDAGGYAGEPNSFDIVTCIGAPFAIGTSDAATDFMLRFLKPGGMFALGDVYLKSRPPEGLTSDENLGEFRSLAHNHDALQARGLWVTGIITASGDDWDRYCSSGWRTTREWADENPEREDREEVMNAMEFTRREYLAFQKEYLGWAILIGRYLPGSG